MRFSISRKFKVKFLKYLFFAIIIVVSVFLVSNIYIYVEHYFYNSTKAENGSIRLNEDLLDYYHGIKLNGDWYISYGDFLSYEDLIRQDHLPKSFIEIPGEWVNIKGHPNIKRDGYATIMLKCKTDYHGELKMSLEEVMSSYELRIFDDKSGENILLSTRSNNKSITDVKVIKSGKIGTSESYSRPNNVYKTAQFKVTGDFNIVLYISNYTFRSGGILKPVYIGTQRVIDDFLNLRLALDYINLSSMLSIVIILVVIFFSYESRYSKISHTLFLILFITVATIKLFTIGSQLIYNIFPYFSWDLEIRLEYVSNSAVFLIHMFLYGFYKDMRNEDSIKHNALFSEKFKNINIAITLLSVIICFILPIKTIAYTKYIFLMAIIYGLIVSIMLFVSLIRMFKNKIIKYLIISGVLSFLLTGAITDIAYYNLKLDFMFGLEMGNFGNTLYSLFSSIVLIYYYVINKKTAVENQNIELMDINNNLKTQKDKQEHLLNNIPYTLINADLGGRILDCYTRSDILGNVDNIKGKNIRTLEFYKSHKSILYQMVKETYEKGKDSKTEIIQYKVEETIYPSVWIFSPVYSSDKDKLSGITITVMEEGKKKKIIKEDDKEKILNDMKKNIPGESPAIRNIHKRCTEFVTKGEKFLAIIGDSGTGKHHIQNLITSALKYDFEYTEIILKPVDFMDNGNILSLGDLDSLLRSYINEGYENIAVIFQNIDEIERDKVLIIQEYLNNIKEDPNEFESIRKIIFTITDETKLKDTDFNYSFIKNKDLQLPRLNEVKKADVIAIIDYIYENNKEITKLAGNNKNLPIISEEAKTSLIGFDFDDVNYPNYLGLVYILENGIRNAIRDNLKEIKEFDVDTGYLEIRNTIWLKKKENNYGDDISNTMKDRFIAELIHRLEEHNFIKDAEHNISTMTKVFTMSRETKNVFIKPIIWSEDKYNMKTIIFTIMLLEIFGFIKSQNDVIATILFLDNNNKELKTTSYRTLKSELQNRKKNKPYVTIKNNRIKKSKNGNTNELTRVKTLCFHSKDKSGLHARCKELFDIINSLNEDFYDHQSKDYYDGNISKDVIEYQDWEMEWEELK